MRKHSNPSSLPVTPFCDVQRTGYHIITLTGRRKARKLKPQVVCQAWAGYEWYRHVNHQFPSQKWWAEEAEKRIMVKQMLEEALCSSLEPATNWTSQISSLSYHFIHEMRKEDKVSLESLSRSKPPDSENCLDPLLPLCNIMLLVHIRSLGS